MESRHPPTGPTLEVKHLPLWSQVEAVLVHLSLLNHRVVVLELLVRDLVDQVNQLTGLYPVPHRLELETEALHEGPRPDDRRV